MIDTHCHLDDARFDSDREAVIQRASAAGVQAMIVPAARSEGWPGLLGLSRRYNNIHPAFGLHPWYCEPGQTLADLAEYLPHAVAVGECGLDAVRREISQVQQLACFRAQLQMAAEHGLPVIVHAVKTVDIVLRELRSLPTLSGVIHGFSGSRQQAEAVVACGFYLGVGSAITRPQNERLRLTLAEFPIECLLLESDAPDQPSYSRRGLRNEPAFVVEIADRLATLRGISGEKLADACNANAQELFGI